MIPLSYGNIINLVPELTKWLVWSQLGVNLGYNTQMVKKNGKNVACGDGKLGAGIGRNRFNIGTLTNETAQRQMLKNY